MLIVLVVNLEICVLVLTSPVGHDMEGTGVGSTLRTDLVLEDVNVEVGSLKLTQIKWRSMVAHFTNLRVEL